MRLCVNVELPDSDLKVGGGIPFGPVGNVGPEALMSQRSLRGYSNRQYKRFFPLILCLENLCKINEWQLARLDKSGVRVAPLYKSGVYYVAEPRLEEEWQDIPNLYERGFGDCEDLACARVGELRYRRNLAAVPCIRHKLLPDGTGKMITLVHVLVLHPSGEVEDPSAKLGMKGEYR